MPAKRRPASVGSGAIQRTWLVQGRGGKHQVGAEGSFAQGGTLLPGLVTVLGTVERAGLCAGPHHAKIATPFERAGGDRHHLGVRDALAGWPPRRARAIADPEALPKGTAVEPPWLQRVRRDTLRWDTNEA